MGDEICGNYILSLWSGELPLAEQARLSILIPDKSFFIYNQSFYHFSFCSVL